MKLADIVFLLVRRHVQFVEDNEMEVGNKDFTAGSFFIHSALQQCTYSGEVLAVLTHLFSGVALIQ